MTIVAEVAWNQAVSLGSPPSGRLERRGVMISNYMQYTAIDGINERGGETQLDPSRGQIPVAIVGGFSCHLGRARDLARAWFPGELEITRRSIRAGGAGDIGKPRAKGQGNAAAS